MSVCRCRRKVFAVALFVIAARCNDALLFGNSESLRYFVVLYFVVLYLVVRYFVVRYFVVRYFVVRYFVVRYFVARYFVVRYFVVRYFVARYFVVRYFMVRYFVVRYFVVRYELETKSGNMIFLVICLRSWNSVNITNPTLPLPCEML